MEYRFKHALLHEVTYESVLLKKRIEYHAVVADWLSDQTEKIGRQAEFSAEIAIHYRNAEESNKASAWYLRAADRAKSIAAPEEARQFYESALDLNPVDNLERRWNILLGHDEVLGILGDSKVRQAEDIELVEMARQSGISKRIARALMGKGHYQAVIGDFISAIEDLSEALIHARIAGDVLMETQLYGLLVVSQTRSGNLEDAFTSAKKALKFSHELNDDETRARVLTNVAILYTETGDIATAARLLEEQVQITRRIGNKAGEAIGLGNLGYDYVQLGLYDKGREALEHSIALAESIGLQLESAYQKLNLSLTLLWSGAPDRCKSLLESTIPDLEEIGDLFGTGAGFNYLGLCLENSGDLEAAMEAYTDSDRLFSEIGANSYALDPTAGLVRCLVDLNREEQARAFIDRIWLNIEGQHCAGMEFPVLAFLTCAEYYLSLDDLESAGRVLRSGYEELMRHANQISDTDWRRSYLENVAAHHRLIKLWERISQQPN
jgi:tetratricopeptide (TPR) repeat protein